MKRAAQQHSLRGPQVAERYFPDLPGFSGRLRNGHGARPLAPQRARLPGPAWLNLGYEGYIAGPLTFQEVDEPGHGAPGSKICVTQH